MGVVGNHKQWGKTRYAHPRDPIAALVSLQVTGYSVLQSINITTFFAISRFVFNLFSIITMKLVKFAQPILCKYVISIVCIFIVPHNGTSYEIFVNLCSKAVKCRLAKGLSFTILGNLDKILNPLLNILYYHPTRNIFYQWDSSTSIDNGEKAEKVDFNPWV